MKIITDNIAHYDRAWWDDLYRARFPKRSPVVHRRYTAAARIAGEGTVVDLGCGDGQAAEHFRADRYTGIDWSGRAIQRARQRFPQHAFRRADLFDVDGQWDVAVALEVFEHLENPVALVGLMLRLAPVAIVSIPNGAYGERVVLSDRRWIIRHCRCWRYHYATYSRADIAAIFPIARFIDVDERHLMFVIERGKNADPAAPSPPHAAGSSGGVGRISPCD